MKETMVYSNSLVNINPWAMLYWLLFAQLVIAFVSRSIVPLGVIIGEDLSLTHAQIGMLPAALFLGQSLVAIPSGFLVDRFGTKRLLFYISLFIGASFTLMTLTANYLVILLLVVLGGMGYGAMHPTSNKGIINWFLGKRGTAMGIKQMGVTTGSALAALLILPAAAVWGWRPVLVGACLFLIVAGFISSRFYADPPRKRDSLYAPLSPLKVLKAITILFKQKILVLISIAAMGLSGGQMIVNTYIVLYAYGHLGIGLVLSSLLLVISEIGGSFGRIAWGIISDNYLNGKRNPVLIMIASISLVAVAIFTFLPSSTPFWVIAPIVFLLGFCISGFNGIWMNAATEVVPIEQAGAASGFSLTVGAWGVIIAPPVFGYIVDFTSSYLFGWLFLCGILLTVIVVLCLVEKVVGTDNDLS